MDPSTLAQCFEISKLFLCFWFRVVFNFVTFTLCLSRCHYLFQIFVSINGVHCATQFTVNYAGAFRPQIIQDCDLGFIIPQIIRFRRIHGVVGNTSFAGSSPCNVRWNRQQFCHKLWIIRHCHPLVERLQTETLLLMPSTARHHIFVLCDPLPMITLWLGLYSLISLDFFFHQKRRTLKFHMNLKQWVMYDGRFKRQCFVPLFVVHRT